MPFDGFNYQGKNFASRNDLQNASRTLRGEGASSLAAIWREIYQEISQADDEAFRQAIETGRIISTLRAGKLIMKRDLSGEGYVFLKPLPQHNLQDRTNYPIFPSISEDLKAKWEKSRPQVSARHFGDGYKTEIQLNTVNRVVKSYFKDIFTSQYELQEALSAQDFGTYITRFFYDERLNQMRDVVPVLQNQSRVVVAGYGACHDCGYEGAPENFKTDAMYPQCPSCGSFRTTKMIEPSIADERRIVGTEEIIQGDITGKLLEFPACRYNPRVMAHESSYFLYSQFVPLRLVRQMFGNDNIPGESGASSDYGLSVMESLSNRGGNTETTGVNDLRNGSSAIQERAVMREMWLEPEWYAGIKLTNPEQTLAGKVPAGVPLEEIFPDGVCVVGFGDMQLQTGVYSERKRIVSGVYFVQSFSGIGKGMSDGVDICKDLNEMHSMAMADIKRHAASGVIIDKDAGLTQADVKKLFKPEGVVFANLNGVDIRQKVHKLQFDSVNQVLPQMSVQLSNLLNLVSLSGDFSEGALQSVDINTLGGQELATAKEEGKKGAILSMKAFHRERAAEEITHLFREHIKMPRYFAFESDRHAATKGKWVSGAELPENLKFDAVPFSEIAQNAFEKKQAAREMVKEAGGIGNLGMVMQQDPRLAAWYTSQYGVEMPQLSQEEIWIVCLSRLENIKKLSEIYAAPEEILANLDKTLFAYEFGHLLKAEYLSQVLDDDEVATWNPVARATVEALIERHYVLQTEAELRKQMLVQRAQMQLQAEAVQAQNAAMQPQKDAENEQMLMQEMAGRVADDEQKQIDFERDQQGKEADHARALEMEEARARNQKKVPARKK